MASYLLLFESKTSFSDVLFIFDVCIAQTMDTSTLNQCKKLERLSENRLSGIMINLSSIIRWTCRRFLINDARKAYKSMNFTSNPI